LAHQGMVIGVDGQHGVAVNELTLGRLPRRPQAGKAHRLAVGACNPGRHRLATSPIGLEEGVSRDNAVIAVLPGIPKAGFAGDSLCASVVGGPGDLGVLRPVRHQTKQTIESLPFWHRLVAHISMWMAPDEAAHITGPQIVLAQVGGRLDAEVATKALAFLDGLVMAAHSRMVAVIYCPCRSCVRRTCHPLLWFKLLITFGITLEGCAGAGFAKAA